MMRKYNVVTTLLSLFIFVIIYFVISYTQPTHISSPQGIFLPVAGEITQPNESTAIEIYFNFPKIYRLLGAVNVEILDKQQNKSLQSQAISYAKYLAKMHGANGLVINFAGYNPEMGSFILQTKAISS